MSYEKRHILRVYSLINWYLNYRIDFKCNFLHCIVHLSYNLQLSCAWSSLYCLADMDRPGARREPVSEFLKVIIPAIVCLVPVVDC